MGKALSTLRERPLDCWLAAYGLLAAVSVPLYLLSPDGTIASFGGKTTPTSRTWVQTVAAGDALFAYLCLEAVCGDASLDTKRMVARAVGVYTVFHMGAFIHGHVVHEPQPRGMAFPLTCLLGCGAASLYWGCL